MLANRSLLQLSPERLCQSLRNSEADAHNQPFVEQWLSMRTTMGVLKKGLKELKGFATP